MHNQRGWTACNFLLPLMPRPLMAYEQATWPETPIRDTATSSANQQDRGVILNMLQGICIASAAVCMLPECAFAQTTRTNPAAASTSPTIQSSSSTSPNAPCTSFNPTSPCYSGRIPRNPCYSAAAPDQPCSTTTTPNPQPSPSPSASKPPSPATGHALTQDQAKVQIEAKGYSNVSGLQKDSGGVWRGKAERDGLVRNVTLDLNGNVAAN